MFSLLPASPRLLPSISRNLRFTAILGRRPGSSSHRAFRAPAQWYNCGTTGHLASSCPAPVRCRLCGREGHISRWCTTPDPSHARPKSCYKCTLSY
ncbi:hypothetical protein B0H11DRAFT_2122752 [Mycena galericulata]|nr:hypothetical protein B0H11DRAFT_2122752 [Mycena galericulata]